MRQRNKTIFTGTYKSILRRPDFRRLLTKTRVTKMALHLQGGPMHGVKLYVGDTSSTLPFTLKGQTGRYLNGQWQPATPAQADAPTTKTMEPETV